MRRHSFSAPARLSLDRLDRATQNLGVRVLSLSRLVSASSSDVSASNSLISTHSRMAIRRCTSCHNYIDGAPDPSLVHVGKYGPDCTSAHHPSPCDHSGKDGDCQFYAGQGKIEQLTPAQLQARDEVRQAELDRMSSELVGQKQNQLGMDKEL